MKRIMTFVGLTVLIAALAGSPVAVAQEKPTLVPLKVQLVISRQSVDKKMISSVPYTLWVTANKGPMTSVRMGVQVPYPTTLISDKGPTPSYSYRDVGTNIDMRASGAANGPFSLEIQVNDSSVIVDPKESASTVKGTPAFRNFTGNFSITLKDGETAQYVSATDPISGETLKIDVTLNVLK